MIRSLSIIIISLLTGPGLFGQSADGNKQLPLSLSDYLSRVTKGNLGYIAEQFNVSISEAQLKAARYFLILKFR